MAPALTEGWWILLSAVVLYALLAVVLHFVSLRLIFPLPPRAYTLTPDYLELTTPDGVTLAARHWPNESARHTLLFFHGNYEDLGSIGEYLPQFAAAGYAVFAFDYRGYGWSGGRASERTCHADARLAFDYLRTRLGVPAERIVLFGYSLGSGPAVELALHVPAAGLILQCAFLSAYRVMTQVPLLPGDKFVNIAKVPRLRLPVLVIHGTADKTVPFRHGRALYRALTAPKMSLFVEGGPHTGLADFAGRRYWDQFRAFTDSL